MEAIGYTSFWGFTPAINFIKGTGVDLSTDDREVNVLLSECCDIRDVLRTLANEVPLKKKREHPLNIYIHEKNKENICRALLLLTLICETNISERERQEMFMDLYANSMIRDKTASYLESIIKELSQLASEDDKCTSVLKDITHFNLLDYKERDDLEDIFSSYHQKHPFDMENLRDHRLRHHFQERYDYRANAVDWDHNFSLKELVPHMNHREYKDWRLTGIAFETRLTTGMTPNRTMGSYIPGKKKRSGDSILVRGYWGDIINSPYIPFGVEVQNEEDSKKFFQKINFQRIYMSTDVSAYNVQGYIHKLETLKEYLYPFERLKKVKESITGEEEEEEPREEEKKDPFDTKDMLNKLTKPGKTITFTDEDEKADNTAQSQDNQPLRELLAGLKQLNAHFYFFSKDLDKTYQKKRFHDLFDIGVLSIHSANQITQDMPTIFKDKARVHVETCDYMVIMKPEQRKEFSERVTAKAKDANWAVVEEQPYKHHLLFEASKQDKKE